MSLHVLLLASRPSADASGPPPLFTGIGAGTLLEIVLGKLRHANPETVTIAMNSTDVRDWKANRALEQLEPAACLMEVLGPTRGAACTALLAIDRIPDSDELLLLAADEFVDCDYLPVLESFRARSLDAGTIVFDSIQPRFSFVRLEGELVVEAAEKEPISRLATAGFYWFRSAAMFFKEASHMIAKRAEVRGQYFVCPVFNEAILSGARVGTYAVDPTAYVPIKTDADAIAAARRRQAL